MRKWVLLLCLSCAHRPGDSPKKLPPWVGDISSACPSHSLCAVGSGPSLIVAKERASAAMARMFNQLIESRFQSSLSQDGGEESSMVVENVETATRLVLAGIHHPKTFVGEGIFYALGVLKKNQGARHFLQKIKGIDQQIRRFLQEKGTGIWFLVERKLQERETLAKHYTFLTNLSHPPPLTLEEWAEKKQEALSGVVVHLSFREEKPFLFRPFLKNVLTSMGHPVTMGAKVSPEATHFLKGQMNHQKILLGVKGFQRFKFIFTLEAQNRKGVKSGSLNLTRIETGRHLSGARARAIPFFKREIGKKLHQISFIREK